jgi:type I restriction enzyme S subunit
MGLTKYKLGELIERSTVNNKDLKYGIDLIAGVNNDGVFTSPKGNPLDVDLKPYKLVNNGAFVYNPTRIDLGSLAYRTEGFCIVSHLYIIFYLNEKGKGLVDPYYLYIYFHRDEFRREVRFRNFGSQRPEFSFSDMADISITLPSIEQQRKFVDVYLALQNNLAAYQSKVEELKLVCDGYMDQLKKKCGKVKVGDYVELCDERNSDNHYTLNDLRGISIQKKFIDTKADMQGVSLSPYIIVKPDYFAFVPVTSRNGEKITLAINDTDDTYIVSSAYTVFRVKDKQKLLPDYLFMFFDRPEFDRYSRFNSWGSAREVFTMDDMNDVRIPIPDISVQKEIVNIHKCYIERQRIAAQLKEQLNNLCPILIKGSLETSN